MKQKYRVTLSQTCSVMHLLTVTVKAGSPEEAERIALQRVEGGRDGYDVPNDGEDTGCFDSGNVEAEADTTPI